jgi:hypothetical protein
MKPIRYCSKIVLLCLRTVADNKGEKTFNLFLTVHITSDGVLFSILILATSSC